jgi:hypothetical protein
VPGGLADESSPGVIERCEECRRESAGEEVGEVKSSRLRTRSRRLAGLVLVTAAALACAAFAPGAGAGEAGCRHSDVVFYTSDTARLATELGKAVAPCTDYYLSITPSGTGGPRGGIPITTIRSLGSRFHAMAEIQLNNKHWTDFAASNGWYATGVEARVEMAAAGYDVTLGDGWALNEVGEPSNTGMAVDVIKDGDAARQHVEDFVRGLYTGPDGTPDPGLVFAADPLQVTTELGQYKQDLLSWYEDSSFWNAMSQYVRFWAQETYADARLWGVAGSTLDQRAGYLLDYFLHGSRLVAVAGGSTSAASAFFANAYTPLANASYRYPFPDTTTGIGFGYTDIGLTSMQHFIATQTYAERLAAGSYPAGDRLGFAVVPSPTKVLPVTATDTLTVEDRVAAAVQGSASMPVGACGASGEWCDSSVDGAGFSDAWKTFTDVTPPLIRPHIAGTLGTNGWYVSDVTVSWTVTDPESAATTTGCDPTPITADTAGLALTCTATSYGGSSTASVTVKRDTTPPALTVPPGVIVDATSPGGATATYAVTATDALGPAPTVQCTPTSGTVFAIGTTTVTCTATDEAGNDTTASFAVHVRGAAEQTAELIDLVLTTNAKQGAVNSLTAKLNAVQQALAAANPADRADASNKLDAFINEVAAQSGKALTPTQGSQLLAAAEQIQAVLG